MKETIDAIYENGVLRPLAKLSMHEGQRVRLLLESKPSEDVSTDMSYDFSDLVGRDDLNEFYRNLSKFKSNSLKFFVALGTKSLSLHKLTIQ